MAPELSVPCRTSLEEYACHILVGTLLMAVTSGASAQTDLQSPADLVGGHSVILDARLSATETFSTNGRLVASNPQAEQISEISPGIRITSQSSRVKGYLDYSLSGLAYAQGSSASSRRQALSSSAALTVVENRVFVDVSAGISQQAVSAFGVQSVDGVTGNGNLSETSNIKLSPSLRGQFGTLVNYEARYSLANSRTASAAASNSQTRDLALNLSGGTSYNSLGWSASATRQSAAYDAGRTTEGDQFKTSLSYAVVPQVRLTAIGGYESNNFSTLDKVSYGTAGWGASWSPSELTRLSFTRDSRFFGESHNLSFEHRTGRTVWRVSDSKDVATSSQATTSTLGSVYELYFAQLASVEPDPVKRAQLVNDFLQANGVNPSATVSRSYLTSSVSLQRHQEVSFALLGIRDTVTFLASRNEGSRLDSVLVANDDFATSSVVRQLGLSVNYSHRLTPDMSFNLTIGQQDSSGSTALQDTSLRSLLFNVSTRLGMKTVATLGARRVVFDSGTSPYNETALTGNINMRF